MSAKFIQIIGKEIMAGGEANNVFTKCFLFALNMAYCEKKTRYVEISNSLYLS